MNYAVKFIESCYPFGMTMPGRNGKTVTGGGWASGTTKVNGVSISETLTIDSRIDNTPAEYKAATSIEFTDGFISSSTDEFTAFIADASNTSTSTNGNASGSSLDSYRYGFNGKELDEDMDGNNYDYGFRIYNQQIGRFLSVDPLSKDYPWYSCFQYAGNNPVANIDADGLEPIPGDPNYGRNLIFGNDKVVQTIMPSVRDKNNENWLAYKAATLDDVVLQTTNAKSNGIKIKNVYIQAHGFGGGLACVNKSSGVTDMSNASNYDGAETLGPGDVKYYLTLVNRINSKDAKVSTEAKDDLANGFDKNKLKAIQNIKETADNMEDGGNLILAGCNAAAGEDGSEFINAVSELVGKRINVLASQDYVTDVTTRRTTTTENGKTSVTEKSLFLDRGRSGKYFEKGWKTANDGKNIDTKLDLKLNSKGNPISSTDNK